MDLARTQAMVGDLDGAVAGLDSLQPSFLTVADLRLNPTWDPLRGHPGFQRLLSGK